MLSKETHTDPWLNCLSLEQLDPLQAKCSEIQALLQGPGPAVPENVVGMATDRDNLLKALQLFGRNFQNHVPLLHATTFNLSTAPPVLVLAMFVVGACYADIVRPASYIFPMVMRVLIHIEQQQVILTILRGPHRGTATFLIPRIADNKQHEIDMTEPPLTSIQASIAACAALGSSRIEAAHMLFPLHFARCLSVGYENIVPSN